MKSAQENPIILELPDGFRASREVMDDLSKAAAKVKEVTGAVLVLVPHGTKRVQERVEHSFGADCDEAMIALPRIAAALEGLLQEIKLGRHNPRTGPRW